METTFSFARNINSIKELNGTKEDLVGNKWFINHPIDVVYGYKYTGICTREEAQAYAQDPKMKTKFYEGEMKIYDKDGNGTIDANDKMILGHCAPTWTGSFTSNLSYKNIDFSFSIYTSQGGMVYSLHGRIRRLWTAWHESSEHGLLYTARCSDTRC